ncbi:hypothetical protein [Maribacter hydrothermalis]|uniref:Uncharacterized protein n=1 Tax=Maribacter hydrothermalis TaxID=1836467 RepID=A0A1B7ZER9_9FLAO|nr:hypothetical protein [Maribacter hydrothermalis]APQ17581.1 hypothetical protein BTR34_09675 [Maribacter hydrothermalis]OBR42056.1 hypothetical protein A9200_01305 [Maribacter hydrothermalis]
MKNMTYLTLFLSSLLLISCSSPEQSSQEELTAITAKTMIEQEDNYLYGIEIYYSSAEAEIKNLENQKIKLVAELENGNKEAMEQIENIQIQIGKLIRFNEFLYSIKKPKGPIGPIPPPKPCLVGGENNCIPIQNISSKSVIVLGEELMVTDIIMKNNKNQSFKTTFESIKDEFGQSALQLKTGLKGEGIMYTTLKTKAVGEITIPTPVISM